LEQVVLHKHLAQMETKVSLQYLVLSTLELVVDTAVAVQAVRLVVQVVQAVVLSDYFQEAREYQVKDMLAVPERQEVMAIQAAEVVVVMQ
jgi:hypothetical protein